MRKRFIPYLLFLTSTIVFIGISGCKKESAIGIDNDEVITTPYSLYAANAAGWLINSNDGENYVSVFPPDGTAPNLMITAGSNLLMLKSKLFLSTNNGKNFNPVYSEVNKFPWQSMAYYSMTQDRIYITSNEGKGIAYSQDKGQTWITDTIWEQYIPPTFEISSFAETTDGTLFAYSNNSNLLFKRENANATWKPVTSEGWFPVDGSLYYLNSTGSTLYLTDYNGIGGAWYSNDAGLHWTKFGQGALPKNIKYYSSAAPGSKAFVVGTENGIFRVEEGGSFVNASNGLDIKAKAYSMTVKKNYYKNGTIRTYIFAASDYGVYRSEDLGVTWDLMTTDSEWKGDYRIVY